ncbi:MAG: histidine--tRNA ligase, partial [Candidatus Sumerlaeia bacterium]|nr:histidine--tRNA ligase [Candidatus Sumerlaeia bacterium]
RDANRARARFAALIGPDEIAAGEVQLKDLSGGEQRRVACAGVPEAVIAQAR